MAYEFPCSYLDASVDLTDERAQHIAQTHPGTIPDLLTELEVTLAEPDLIRSSDRDPDALLFSRWFETIRTGRYLVVVVVQGGVPPRHWIVTTYTARKITGGKILWQNN